MQFDKMGIEIFQLIIYHMLKKLNLLCQNRKGSKMPLLDKKSRILIYIKYLLEKGMINLNDHF